MFTRSPFLSSSSSSSSSSTFTHIILSSYLQSFNSFKLHSALCLPPSTIFLLPFLSITSGLLPSALRFLSNFLLLAPPLTSHYLPPSPPPILPLLLPHSKTSIAPGPHILNTCSSSNSAIILTLIFFFPPNSNLPRHLLSHLCLLITQN